MYKAKSIKVRNNDDFKKLGVEAQNKSSCIYHTFPNFHNFGFENARAGSQAMNGSLYKKRVGGLGWELHE